MPEKNVLENQKRLYNSGLCMSSCLKQQKTGVYSAVNCGSGINFRECCKEISWPQNFLKEFQERDIERYTLLCDNQTALGCENNSTSLRKAT